MEHTSDNLEHFSEEQKIADVENKYTPRPKLHLFVAWVLIAIVLFAFLGMCYWMVAYGKG